MIRLRSNHSFHLITTIIVETAGLLPIGIDLEVRIQEEKENPVAHLVCLEQKGNWHVEHYQRFHLIKLLQVPPETNGRYVCAGRFVEIARELDMPMNHLTRLLIERNGRPYNYWRIGTTPGGEASIWDMMLRENNVAIGWPDLGDLSDVTYDRDSKKRAGPRRDYALRPAFGPSNRRLRTGAYVAGNASGWSKRLP